MKKLFIHLAAVLAAVAFAIGALALGSTLKGLNVPAAQNGFYAFETEEASWDILRTDVSDTDVSDTDVSGTDNTDTDNTDTDNIDSVESGDVLRLHIIANSDSQDDQRVKLLVRDAVLGYVKTSFTATTTEQAEMQLILMGDGILEAAEDALRDNGCDYGAQLIAGVFDFPDRVYNGVLYPAGEYRALRVVLGAGEGKNWWCVMFPPLCIIIDGNEPQTDEPVKFESLFAELWRKLFS